MSRDRWRCEWKSFACRRKTVPVLSALGPQQVEEAEKRRRITGKRFGFANSPRSPYKGMSKAHYRPKAATQSVRRSYRAGRDARWPWAPDGFFARRAQE